MANPQFHQAERRSFLIPVLLALVLIACAVGVARFFFPATSIDIEYLHTDLLPTHTVFATDSKVVGASQAQDVLLVATTARIHNGMKVPIFVDGASCTFTDQAGAVLKVKAVERAELANSQISFPKLTPLLEHPLYRDTTIEPGKSAEGTLLLSFPFTPAQWQARRSAVVEVDLYHQHPVYLTIPDEAGPHQVVPNQTGKNKTGQNRAGPNQQGPDQQGPDERGPDERGSDERGLSQP